MARLVLWNREPSCGDEIKIGASHVVEIEAVVNSVFLSLSKELKLIHDQFAYKNTPTQNVTCVT